MSLTAPVLPTASQVIASDDRTVQTHLDELENQVVVPYRVRNLYDYFPNNENPVGDMSAYLNTAINDIVGGELRIPDGQYTAYTQSTVDYSSAVIPPVGRASQRFSFIGDTQHNTTFNTNGNTLLSYTGDAEGDGQGLFSSMEFSNFCVYGQNNTGVALRFKSAVGLNLNNIQVRRHNYGFFFSGVLTSMFTNLYVDYCNNGVYLESAANSQVNNTSFIGLKANSCNQHAMIGDVGIRFSLIGCSFESCGWNTNDTGGTSSTGTIYLNAVVPFTTINISDDYFEANEGLADITINNNTASPIIVNITNTCFTRGNVRGRGSSNFLNFLSSGGGPILLNLRGNSFITNTGTGFVPTPAWVSKPFLKVSGLDTCMFSDPTSMPGTSTSAGQGVPVCITAAGAISSGPSYLACTKTATGVYQVTSTYSLGDTVDGFVVLPSPRVTGFRVDVTKNSNINLTVRVRDATSTLTDGAFDLAIITGRGEGR